MMASKLDYPKRHAGLFRKPEILLRHDPKKTIGRVASVVGDTVSVELNPAGVALIAKMTRRSRKVAKKAPAPAKTKGKR
jgi:hypothetical protein